MGLIRLVLALAVLLSHLPGSPFKFISGAMAVQSFFIISGFYMALVLDGKYADRGLFYSNRLLRLAPTYAAMAAITAVALFVFRISATATPELFQTAYANPLTAAVMVFENIAVVGQELLFWFRISDDGGLIFDSTGVLPGETTTVGWQALLVPQSWSLSMELMFYALAPFLARMSWKAVLGVAVASIALRFAGHWLPVDYPLWAGRLFPTALFLFLLGMLAHRALPLAKRTPRAVGVVLAVVMLAVLMFLPLVLPVLGWKGEPVRFGVYLAVAATTPFIFNAFRTVGWDRWIGELSYPLYLCHLFVIAVLLQYAPEGAPWLVWAAIGASIAMSALLVMLIEAPVDRWRQARVRRSSAEENPPVF